MLYPIFYLKTLIFAFLLQKTPLVKENYFLTLWNFPYLKDTSFGKKSCNFEHGLETKNEFEKWPLITFFQCNLKHLVRAAPVTERSLSLDYLTAVPGVSSSPALLAGVPCGFSRGSFVFAHLLIGPSHMR